MEEIISLKPKENPETKKKDTVKFSSLKIQKPETQKNKKKPIFTKFQSHIKSSDWENSVFNLFQKPETNFDTISTFNLDNIKPMKIKSLKKHKKFINTSKCPKPENIKKYKKTQNPYKQSLSLQNPIFLEKQTKTEKNQKTLLNIIGKPLDFDSESEKIIDNPLPDQNFQNFVFCKEPDFFDFEVEEELVINFYDFLKERSLKEDLVKMHKCKFCDLKFKRHTALGGHVAKNHPNKSNSYKKRKKSLENRVIERSRLNFLKNF